MHGNGTGNLDIGSMWEGHRSSRPLTMFHLILPDDDYHSVVSRILEIHDVGKWAETPGSILDQLPSNPRDPSNPLLSNMIGIAQSEN